MRIAVVGSGIAGSGAAWALSDAHEVVVYEAQARPGGHSHTVDTPGPDGPVPVDTGFIVYNTRNYPNLVRLFDTLGVATQPSTMSFSVSLDDGRLEYAGDETGLFLQRRNLVRPRFLRMAWDILRFYREAPRMLSAARTGDPVEAGPDLGTWLAARGYGQGFVEDHLLPMAAAIWSCPTRTMMRFPVISFLRFFDNHGLLKLQGRPQWRTVTGGSRAYLARLTAPFADRIRLGAAVTRVTRQADGVEVADAHGHRDRFDHVVFGTHADEALAAIAAPTPEERAILGAFRFQENRAILHADAALMPKRRRAWAAWSYMGDSRAPGERRVSLTYWMNALQSIPDSLPRFVSLNPLREPDPGRVFGSWTYTHPVFDQAAVAAQPALARLQGADRLWFCGAWCGWGFHEDGLSAGLRVAQALGARLPWPIGSGAPPVREAA